MGGAEQFNIEDLIISVSGNIFVRIRIFSLINDVRERWIICCRRSIHQTGPESQMVEQAQGVGW